MTKVNPLATNSFETEVEDTALKLWTLVVRKVGKAKAKEIMKRVMGDKKPGPKSPLERLLNSIIEASISNYAHESDEKIAKRISAKKLCFVLYQSGSIGVTDNDELDRGDGIYVDDDGSLDIVTEWKPIGKQAQSLKKRVERIRRQMIEGGVLPKEYAPKKYYLGTKSASASRT